MIKNTLFTVATCDFNLTNKDQENLTSSISGFQDLNSLF